MFRNLSPLFVGLIGLIFIGLTYGVSGLLFSESTWPDYQFGLNFILTAEVVATLALVWASSGQSAQLVLPVRTTVATVAILWVGGVLVTVLVFGGLALENPKLLRALLFTETGLAVIVGLSLQFANRGATAGTQEEATLRVDASSTVSQWEELLFELENGECPEELLGEVKRACERIKFSSAVRDASVRASLEEAVTVIRGDPTSEGAMMLAKKANAMV